MKAANRVISVVDKPIQKQVDQLINIVLKNPYINKILNGNPFPQKTPWYLGAGCICQSAWNYLSGKEILSGIKDYDLVYYDAGDISKESEIKEQKRINKKFSSISAEIEVVNEARVYLWFEEDFGQKIDQFKSCEDSINQWPTTATAVGINKTNGRYNVYAPYGLNDLFGMVAKPNKPFIQKWVYEKKVKRWAKIWPNLKIIPWKLI